MTFPPYRPSPNRRLWPLLRPLAVALALGMAIAAPPPSARAAANASAVAVAALPGTALDVQALAAEVMANGDAARDKLRALFLATALDIDATVARARALIGALKGDPGAVTDAALLISDMASRAMEAPRIYRVSLDPAFALAPDAHGWDLGPALSPLYPGFRRVTPAGLVAGDAPLRSFAHTQGDGLSSDGIFNVHGFAANVPDGDYRLIVLTGDPGGRGLDRPFGETVAVAGVTRPIANPDTERWIDGARLFAPGVAGVAGAANKFAEPFAGALVLNVQVSKRRLFVDLSPDGKETYITGLILEPLDAPSALATPNPPPDPARIMLAEARVAEAIGGLLETVATAAGGPAARARIFKLAVAPIEDAQTVSPN